ncbi:hypothetical protein I204_07503 [Kwoniella mangroviensis CBS 8886]|nr:uncharacterized protein I203_08442 [Kwoniella mangroviensis CBS 8507]OCF62470.1 hypothetical protein I203_08442 [Kwoniella mangroviensis CBS 8507]OCF72238.1 hypothetical protein I204_07503 [Kwoniella mangroviensis CBS 8886]
MPLRSSPERLYVGDVPRQEQVRRVSDRPRPKSARYIPKSAGSQSKAAPYSILKAQAAVHIKKEVAKDAVLGEICKVKREKELEMEEKLRELEQRDIEEVEQVL